MHSVIRDIVQLCRDNPSLLLFAALAAGYALGNLKFGGFSLGSTTSVLLVAIVLGAATLRHTHFDLGIIKTVSFGLFIFAIGYKVGPDFVGGIRRGGAKYITIAVFFCFVALIAAVGLAKAFGFNKGYSAGLLGGALTQSTVIGTADGALKHLAGEKVTSDLSLDSDVAVAYAVTYVFGTAGVIILVKLLYGIWGINLPQAAKQAEAEMGSGQENETVEAFSWENLVMPRAYLVANENAIGATVAALTAKFPARVSIDRVKKGDLVIKDVAGGLKLERGDTVLLTGYQSGIFKGAEIIGPEVDAKTIGRMIGEILGICVTNKALDGRSLAEILLPRGRGCFVRGVTRQGHALPLTPNLKVRRGDVINVIGERDNVEGLAKALGYPERASDVADLVTVGLGIIVGTLLGLVAISIGGIPITLGIGGGVLVSGIFFGWLRSTRPTWGYIPTPTVWLFTSLGLNLFIACVGISAGPKALAAIRQAGGAIFLAGVCLTCIPHVLTWLFGLYVIKLNPVLLLGAMTGAGTCTAALNVVKDDSKSAVCVIGYTVPYAIGNVLLTVWGALIVNIV